MTTESTTDEKEKLNLLLEIAREKHNNRRQEIQGQSKKAELLFLATGFTFAGVAGLYQVDILNKNNEQQVILLILEFALIILFTILAWLWKRKEHDSPAVSGLIALYDEGKMIKSIQIEIVNSYKESEEFNRSKLEEIAIRMNIAFSIMLLVYVSIIIFILFPTFRVCVN
ncbi:MAG: hypothetical protein ACKUBY_03960 [Candidatus Moraniibacteriota bacterium]|jgi:hypothetical protein